MSADEVLLGLGLVLVLGIGSQLVAATLRLPSIVVLLPVGFVAGACTDVVHPDRLLGDLFQPFVSLGVGLILFEAGLRLSLDELQDGLRRVVLRLLALSVVVTFATVAVVAGPLFGIERNAAVMIGAILIVSGPTVVMPMLSYIRPAARVRSALKWEGILIDPVGAIIAVLVYHVIVSGAQSGQVTFQPGELAISLAVGAAVGAAGAGLLWLILRTTDRIAPDLGVMATLMVVVGALVAADLLREDAGFVATTVMGVVLANQERLDVAGILEFQETIGQLLIGVLFVLLAASVSPAELRDVLLPGLVLVALLVVAVRPAVVALATWGSSLDWRERAFAAWMAPRGIVAAATASAFGLGLVEDGIPDAGKILPIVFVVIFATVVLYGLTAGPLARSLGVAGRGAPVVLIVGGHAWARELAGALVGAGMQVRLWTGRAAEAAAAARDGLSVRHTGLVADAMSREAELEGVGSALLMTSNDEFNALASADLRRDIGGGSVYRLAPATDEVEVVPPRLAGAVLFDGLLSYDEISRRFARGARLVQVPVGPEGALPTSGSIAPLFVATAGGGLRVVRAGEPPDARPGDTVIALSGG